MPFGVKKRALILVRTYPVPDESGIESSCTAAITSEGEWLRIFPVPWRLLPEKQRFRKYDWVNFDLVKATSDTRPESHRLQPSGAIEIDSSEDEWQNRKSIVLPRRSHCLCCLAKERDQNQRPTLGIIRPHAISRLRIAPDPEPWTDAQLAMLRQQHFFAEPPEEELEKIPYRFYYDFRCAEDECRGHTLMCTDWEVGQSYRSWRGKYGDDGWQEKFRQKYETWMLGRDLHFYVGTVASHPNRWIVIGLFYPPIETESAQQSLF